MRAAIAQHASIEVWIFAVVFGLLGLVFVVLGAMMTRGRFPPGPIGFKTFETLSDTEVWYAANRYSGRDFSLLGVLMFVYAVVSPWWRPMRDPMANAFISIVGFFFASLALSIRGWLYGIRVSERLKKERASRGEPEPPRRPIAEP